MLLDREVLYSSCANVVDVKSVVILVCDVLHFITRSFKESCTNVSCICI